MWRARINAPIDSPAALAGSWSNCYLTIRRAFTGDAHRLRVTSSQSSSLAERFPALDLARIAAAVAVVFYHYGFFFGVEDPAAGYRPWPGLATVARYGHLGVQLFFMISGFLVLQSAYSKTVAGFFRARALRLYPAYLTCCTITVLIAFAVPNEQISWNVYAYNTTMLNGLIDSLRGVPATYVDGSYWTLGVEWKFYLLVAAMILLGQLARIERALWIWTAVSVFAAIRPSVALDAWALTPWSPYFIAGAIFFRGHVEKWTAERVTLGSICFALCLAQASLQNDYLSAVMHTPFIKATTLFAIAIFFGFFAALSTNPVRITSLKPNTVVLLGALSYPVYLLHLRIGALEMRAWWGQIDRYLLLLIMFAIVIVLAYVVHVYVELPVWRTWRRSPRFVRASPAS